MLGLFKALKEARLLVQLPEAIFEQGFTMAAHPSGSLALSRCEMNVLIFFLYIYMVFDP